MIGETENSLSISLKKLIKGQIIYQRTNKLSLNKCTNISNDRFECQNTVYISRFPSNSEPLQNTKIHSKILIWIQQKLHYPKSCWSSRNESWRQNDQLPCCIRMWKLWFSWLFHENYYSDSLICHSQIFTFVKVQIICHLTFFSSPEPKAHWWAYRIGRHPLSVVCPSIIHSSQKPLGRLKPNFIWSLHGIGEQKFVQTVLVTWPR